MPLSEKQIQEAVEQILAADGVSEQLHQADYAKRLNDFLASPATTPAPAPAPIHIPTSAPASSRPSTPPMNSVDIKQASEQNPMSFASVEFGKRKKKISPSYEAEIENDFSAQRKDYAEYLPGKGFFENLQFSLGDAEQKERGMKSLLKSGFAGSLTFITFIFLMNLVIAATRGLEFSIFHGTLALSKSSVITSLFSDSNILMGFWSIISNGSFVIVKSDSDSFYEIAFRVAKRKFKNNSHAWFVSVLKSQDMCDAVDNFYKELKCFVFSNFTNGEMLGLSSITGEYVFVRDGLNMAEAVIAIQHELVHSFFRFFAGTMGTLDPLMLSPSQYPYLKFGGEPVHSGYLYDYLFSMQDMINPVSPFSLLCKKSKKV